MRAVRSTGEGVEIVDVDDPEGPGELLTMRTPDRAAGAIKVVMEIA